MWKNPPTNFNKVVKNLVKDTVREVAIDGVGQVTQRSPVRTGRYKGNHNVGIGNLDTSESGTSDNALIRANSVLSSLPDWPVVYISNSVPYAQKLEDGFSPQAASGIYRPTFTILAGKYKRIVK